MSKRKHPAAKAAKKNDEPILLGTLNPRQVQILGQAKMKAVQLTRAAEEAQQAYRDMLGVAMPDGANAFDEEKLAFYYDPSRVPNQPPEGAVTGPESPESDEDDAVGEVSAPAGDTDDS